MLRILTALVPISVATLVARVALGGRGQGADFVACGVVRTAAPGRVSWLDETQLADAVFEEQTRPRPEALPATPDVAAHWDFTRRSLVGNLPCRDADATGLDSIEGLVTANPGVVLPVHEGWERDMPTVPLSFKEARTC